MRGPFDLRGRFTLGSQKATGKRIYNSQYLAASALLRRLYGFDEPGAILADEVGLGKTYVAFGVAAWLLSEKPKARVLVLTNSKYMMEVWAGRWNEIKFRNGQERPEAIYACNFEQYRQLAGEKTNRLIVSSYETLKRFGLDDWARVRASIGHWLFKPYHRPGTRFTRSVARSLMRGLDIDLRVRAEKLGRRIPVGEAERFWNKHFDWKTRCWKDPDEARWELENLELRWGTTGGYSGRSVPFELVIVDEAHRLDAHTRREAMELLLHDRTRKILYVTATPFALDVRQLERLLSMFSLANGCDRTKLERAVKELDLRGFEHAVDTGKDYDRLGDLERKLRRWIVRRSWSEESTALRRKSETWAIPPDAGEGYAATLALERAIADLLIAGERTHIASRRAGLCSSWRAACDSFKQSPLGEEAGDAVRWSRLAVRLIKSHKEDSPKIQEAVKRIADLVLAGRKVLIFSERAETLSLVRDLLKSRLEPRERIARRMAERLLAHFRRGKRLRLGHADFLSAVEQRALLRMMAGNVAEGIPWDHIPRSAKAWLAGAAPELRASLQPAFGGRQPIRAVEIYDGERGDNSTITRFNMPGTPWVLLCGQKAQESIDLHHECNTVVLLDPIWNPARREQRIGRVHRAGSRFPEIHVIDVYTAETYDEVIFRRSQKRANMMAILLGAGRWLNEEREIANPSRYRINLSPRSKLEHELAVHDSAFIKRH